VSNQQSVERHLIVVLGAIACIAVLGVLAILPYRLYMRDIRQASVDAHRVSRVVHTALSRLLLDEHATEQDVADLINRFQGIADLEIRLRQLPEGEVHPAATSGKGSSTRDDTDLTYVSPPIIDREGHTWLASMYFDLSAMKQRSLRLIIDLVLAVVLGSLAFSLVIFLLVRRSLIDPIRQVTREIERIADAGPGSSPSLGLPEFESREMAGLASAVSRACAAKSR
jgi:hypothetical protein